MRQNLNINKHFNAGVTSQVSITARDLELTSCQTKCSQGSVIFLLSFSDSEISLLKAELSHLYSKREMQSIECYKFKADGSPSDC